jgi:hypothetical protein
MVNIYRIPLIVQRMIAFALDFVYPRIAQALRAMPRSTSDLRQIYEEIGNYREDFADRFMSAGLDAIICPVQVKEMTDCKGCPQKCQFCYFWVIFSNFLIFTKIAL